MWHLPLKNLLKTSTAYNEEEEMENAWQQASAIEAKTDELGFPLNIEKIDIGPSTILFRAIPAEKIAIRSLRKLESDLAYELGSECVSIQAPLPGEKYVGIYCARSERRMVMLGDIL